MPTDTPQTREREELLADLRESQEILLEYDLTISAANVERAIEAITTLTRELTEARAEIAEKENSIQGQARLVGEFAAKVRAMQRQIDEARRVLSYESIRGVLAPAPEVEG